jgi:glutamyl endopeptidase
MSHKGRGVPPFRGLATSIFCLLLVAASAAPAQDWVSSDGRMGEASAMGLEAAGFGQPFAGSAVLGPEILSWAFRGALPADANLTPKTAKMGQEVVIGSDTRFRVYTNNYYPARATVRIIFAGGAMCSGAFIGPRLILTMGHCVHTGGPGGGFYNVGSYVIQPGYNVGAPFGSYSATLLVTTTTWANTSNEQYDFGLIRLGTNVGNSVGWYGYWWQTASEVNTPAITNGYPGDKGGTTQWLGGDKVRVSQTLQNFYKNDTYPGQSGSPVWEDRPPGSQFCSNGPCIHTIHGYGLHGSSPHSNHNHGTRITQQLFDIIGSFQ